MLIEPFPLVRRPGEGKGFYLRPRRAQCRAGAGMGPLTPTGTGGAGQEELQWPSISSGDSHNTAPSPPSALWVIPGPKSFPEKDLEPCLQLDFRHVGGRGSDGHRKEAGAKLQQDRGPQRAQRPRQAAGLGAASFLLPTGCVGSLGEGGL